MTVRGVVAACAGCGHTRPVHALGCCHACYENSDILGRCSRCGAVRPRHPGRLSLCADCHTSQPERVLTWLANRPPRTARMMPPWFGAVATQWAEGFNPQNALRHLLRLERALLTGVTGTDDILAAVNSQPGGRATTTLLREFFAHHDMPIDQTPPLSTRRQRWLDRIPPRMRTPVADYLGRLDTGRQRASLYGNNALSDRTINYQLAILVHFAEHLATRNVADWSAVTATDVESYLVKDAARRLATLKAFFAFSRKHKIVLVDPTGTLSVKQRKGYRGPLLTTGQQRDLLRRWQRPDIDPRERITGLLGLLHAASNHEVRHLRVTDITTDRSTLHLGTRPHPVPIDPLTADAIDTCLDQRATANTTNPYLLIGFHTRLHHKPCSINFPRQLLQRAGVTPQLLRATRLTDLTQRLDPRVVAEALDITHEAALHYLTGSIQREDTAFGDTRES